MSIELERERAVQALCAHFSQDHLTTGELELRFEQVYRAGSSDELRALLGGLPALTPTTLVPEPFQMYSVAPAAAPAVNALPPREKRFLAFMADVRRQGVWNVPPVLNASAFMGAVRIDMREAQIPAGGVDIDATAIMGEVKIILPPGLHADVDGLAIMGEFIDKTASAATSLDAPMIRVKGSAVMGSVRVETRMPRETVMEAWKRRIRGF